MDTLFWERFFFSRKHFKNLILMLNLLVLDFAIHLNMQINLQISWLVFLIYVISLVSHWRYKSDVNQFLVV